MSTTVSHVENTSNVSEVIANATKIASHTSNDVQDITQDIEPVVAVEEQHNSDEKINTQDNELLPEIPSQSNEQPMPSEEECLLKHLGKKLHEMLYAQSEEARQAFENEFSPKGMAVDTELAKRAMRPHIQNLHFMQSYAKHLKSNAERKKFETGYNNTLRKYKETEDEFSQKQNELKSCVRAFVHTEMDKAEQARVLKYKHCKPLSKGRRRHFWEALSRDNVDTFQRTIETINDVKDASHSIQNPVYPDNHTLSLLCAFVNPHPTMPVNGAHQTLSVLLTTFRSFFTNTDIEQTKQYILTNGCEKSHASCLDVLTTALS